MTSSIDPAVDVDDATGSTTTSTSSRSTEVGPPRWEPVPEGETDTDAIVDAIERRRHRETGAILEDDGRHIQALRNNRPESFDLPGFGEPDDDCGEYVLPAMRFCDHCGKTHEFKHNCLRYDCPQHAPYAVRRRAAGSASENGMVGIAPQLDAGRRFLNYHREENQRFHHFGIMLPDDFFFKDYADGPFQALKELVADICEELGVQGFGFFHPWAGDNEDVLGDDRGKWRKRLFHRRAWDGDVRDEVRDRHHVHIIGIAHHVDGEEVTKRIEDETGIVIDRFADDETGISIENDHALARALTYCLSHTGIYETDGGQRRLATWSIGPDIKRIETFDKSKRIMRPIVYEVAEETLGIDAPSLECEHELDADRDEPPEVDVDVESGAVSIDSWPWPDGPNGVLDLPRERGRTELPRDQHVEGVAGMADAPGELRGSAGDVGDDLGAGTSGGAGDRDRDRDDQEDDDEELEACGGQLRHISKAAEYLATTDWVRSAPFAEDLDVAYVSYVRYMESRGLDALEDDPRPTLPEADDRPPDPPPDD